MKGSRFARTVMIAVVVVVIIGMVSTFALSPVGP